MSVIHFYSAFICISMYKNIAITLSQKNETETDVLIREMEPVVRNTFIQLDVLELRSPLSS